MYLILFPGSFSYDVPFQLRQVFTGEYSSSHPLLHTLLLGSCVALGHMLGSINAGAALYSALQMTGLAACFTAVCASICRQCGARAARWSTLFFALYPLHMMYAVNATKDVLFGGLFALTAVLVREALTTGQSSRRLPAVIAACGAGMMLLRHNAVLAVAIWAMLALLLLRKRALCVVAAIAASALVCTGVNTVLEAATGADGGNLRELLSWPIQQTARARLLYGDTLSEEEKAAIDEVLPDSAWQLYDPTISDPVKYQFDTERFLSDPGRYIRTYLSIGSKCPKAYFDALLIHTYSYWYPYSEYRVSGYYLQMGVTDQYYEWCDFERISSQSILPRVRASLEWRFGAQGAMQMPLAGWPFNMGVIVWIMLYFVIREAWRGNRRSFAAALLPAALWATYLMGPVMAGRYLYPCVCCLPVLAVRDNKLCTQEPVTKV